MEATLKEGFNISVASKDDITDIWRVFLEAYGKDEIWDGVVQNVVNPKDILPWLCLHFASRWEMPDVTTYKITEIASGAIVGWGALQTPWKYLKSEMTAQLKAKATSTELPSVLEGMNTEALGEFFKTLYAAKSIGYDPELDYHRRGSMIVPKFQGLGFGTYLAQFCNQISDAKGDRQWVPARPTSVNMFKKNGYIEMGVVDAHIERWGGLREKSNTYLLLHCPPNLLT
ncbi:hypothetical protein OnM2_103037 [Erysiphe neolycopersici]|uniref:N-acetyltransferase domain-containing protein n=1 Tax=Erysiphe neolycopersici TaxID=212602 RepID=A0A420H8B2_9PEZI|nr:hypothetical protein OnM2_103037 [Erysiphe neolycopersici]